jgi:hypothetical protein
MSELFASDSALRLEGFEGSAALGRSAATALQPKAPFVTAYNPALTCFIDDDEGSCEARAMKSFLYCSQDWEQLSSLTFASVGATVQ